MTCGYKNDEICEECRYEKSSKCDSCYNHMGFYRKQKLIDALEVNKGVDKVNVD